MPRDSQPAFDQRSRASFMKWVTIPIRFADQDILGHVNNAATATYLEQGRCEHLIPLIEAAHEPDLDIVLARIIIDYIREIRYPGTAEVGVRISHIGNKSFVINASVFVGDTCSATSAATIVFFDKTSRTSRLPPAHLRASLQSLT